MISRSKKLDIVFTVILISMLFFGVGYQIGNTFTGTTNTFAVGSLETADVNFTGDWFRGNSNLTDILANPEQETSYIIFKSASIAYAKNGETGQIDFSSSDDGSVFSSVIDEMTDGGIIFLKGDFSFSNIEVTANITIEGEGPRTTFINANSSSVSIFKIAANSSRVTFKNIGFTNTNGFASVTGIFIQEGITRPRVEDSIFSDMAFGIDFNASTAFINFARIINNRFNNCTTGIRLNGINPFMSNAGVYQNNLYRQGGIGLHIILGNANLILGEYFTQNTDDALVIQSNAQRVTNIHFDGNTGTYDLNVTSNNNRFTGIFFTSAIRVSDTGSNNLFIGGFPIDATPGTTDFQNNAVTNLGAAGNDFGASNTFVASTFSGNILASGASTIDIGSTAAEINNLYLGTGKLFFQADQEEYITSTGSALIFGFGGVDELQLTASRLAPSTAGGTNLGGTSNEWGNLYLGNGKIFFFDDQGETIGSNGTHLKIDGSSGILPDGGNNTGAIGADSERWANGWFTTVTAKTSVTGKVIETEIAPAPWEFFEEGDVVKIYDANFFVKTESILDYVVGVVTSNPQQIILGYNASWELVPKIILNETIIGNETILSNYTVWQNTTIDIPIYGDKGTPVLCVGGKVLVKISEPVMKNDILVAGPDGKANSLRATIEVLKSNYSGVQVNWNNILKVQEIFSLRTIGYAMEDSGGLYAWVMLW